MSDESTWHADGATLYMSPKRSASWVGLHNATLARHIAEWHNAQLSALVAEVEQWHATNRDAVQALAKSEAKLHEVIERIGELDRMLEHERERAGQAEAKASILAAQLGGWEAQCAAQVILIREMLAHAERHIPHNMRARAETVIETDAGRVLLERLQAMQAWMRRATHLDDCALQNGGPCDCGKSDLLRGTK